MKKEVAKNILPFSVATLIFINGLVNILLAITPLKFLSSNKDLTQTSHLLQYVVYQQPGSALTVFVGLLLILLAVGLYHKKRNAWLWSIIILGMFCVRNIYPDMKLIPLCLGLFSMLILISFYRHFYVKRQTAQTYVIVSWLSIIFAIGYGSVGCYLMRAQFKGIHNFTDAIYYTLVTYSTVGYGDINPLTSNAKLFVITMIFIGLGSFATVVSVLIGPMLEQRLKKVFTMVEQLNHLRHHAIFHGVNQITQKIAIDLKNKGLGILFIDTDQQALASLNHYGFGTLCGDITDPLILKKAGLLDASYLVCADSSNDARNILLTMTARNLLKKSKHKTKAKIITILDRPENEDNARQSGADELIIPALLTSQKVLTMLD